MSLGDAWVARLNCRTNKELEYSGSTSPSTTTTTCLLVWGLRGHWRRSGAMWSTMWASGLGCTIRWWNLLEVVHELQTIWSEHTTCIGRRMRKAAILCMSIVGCLWGTILDGLLAEAELQLGNKTRKRPVSEPEPEDTKELSPEEGAANLLHEHQWARGFGQNHGVFHHDFSSQMERAHWEWDDVVHVDSHQPTTWATHWTCHKQSILPIQIIVLM